MIGLLFPIERLIHPLMQTMLPVLCRLLNEPDPYRNIYVRVVSLSLLVSWPGCWAMACSDTLVPLLLEEKWKQASAIVTPFALASLPQMINNASGSLIDQGSVSGWKWRFDWRCSGTIIGNHKRRKGGRSAAHEPGGLALTNFVSPIE